MATGSASLLLEETGLPAALNQAPKTSPEVLGTIYMAHHRHVLRVCRRFFRHPEDAEDASGRGFFEAASGSG